MPLSDVIGSWKKYCDWSRVHFPTKPFSISETGAGGVWEWKNATDCKWSLLYQKELVAQDVKGASIVFSFFITQDVCFTLLLLGGFLSFILPLSLCLSHFVSITLSLSLCLYHFVSLTSSLSLCLSHFVSLTSSLSLCLSHFVSITFFLFLSITFSH